MCGIAGIIDYTRPLTAYADKLAEMQARLRHRGPDAQGVVTFDHAGLVHTRLSIIDLAGSRQPFTSADGRYAITYNGEVYNYRALRDALKTHWNFQSNGDTEVVLAAWATWGPSCLEKLNGMFAFFIWDRQDRQGWLVRDRLGIKPLVYTEQTGMLAFASEAKALAGLFAPVKANEDAILEYLAAPFFSGVASSMFSGIETLQPGQMLSISRAGVRLTQWADYRLDIDHRHQPDLAGTLRSAITHTLVSDVPVCTFLSGGFDSTLIAALAQQGSDNKLDSYTITFEGQDGFSYSDSTMTNADDTPVAIAAANEIGSLNTLVMAPRQTLMDRVKQIAIANDALPAWEQELAQNQLSAAASQDYKVVLVGDAADETHYGYHFLLDPMASSSPQNVMARFSHDRFINPARLAMPAAHFDAQYRQFVAQNGYAFGTSANDDILATTYLVVKRWLPRLLHNGDIHTMQYGLEARVPFGDIHLLEQARQIAPHHAYRDGQEKSWLRACAKGLMPENVRTRKKSALPKDQNVAALYQQELRRILMADDGFIGYFIDRDKALDLCDRAPDEKDRALMFRIICLSHWQTHYKVAI
jgi:asparagine synthase (glutamine-hydrolysing)